MTDKQQPKKLFRWAIILIGAAVSFFCFYSLPSAHLDFRLLILTVTIVLAARATVQIPSISYHITVSDTLIFLTMLMYGGEAAVLMASVDGMCSSARVSSKPSTIFFNSGVMAISTFLTFAAIVLGIGPVLGSPVHDFSSGFVATATLMTLVQYLSNTGLIAIDRSLKTGDSLWQTWRKHYLWTSITYLAGASSACVTARLISEFGFYPLILTAPIIAIVYFTYRTYLKSVEASEAQAQQAVSHVEEQQKYISELESIKRELQESREHFRNAALHDDLTGLPNRGLLLDRLRVVVAQAKRSPDHHFAVLFLDLDRFKMINDSLGHVAGDELLIATGRRLQKNLRTADTVARLGGDEFAIVLDGFDSTSDVLHIVQRLQRDLIQPHYIHGQEVYTTASIGITLSSTGYESAETILRDADTAMYRAKQNGKARYELFDTNMHAEAVAMLRLESDLRRALDRKELRVFYQPIISLIDEKISGFEALVRWQHPTRGLVLPNEFIPTAEDTGLIIDIGQWVLTEACRQMQEWRMRGMVDSSMTMSVNLSNKQFTSTALADQVKGILAQTYLPPTFLSLEVTENVVAENSEQACTTLHELRELGVHLSIDDFGTGYSSLSYLHRFPVHTLKIDRSFISNMSSGDENSAIVRTIISLAENLSMNVIAEGIETDAQRLRLKEFGCNYAQGYFFARPAPATSIETLLQNENELYGLEVKSDDAALRVLSLEFQECTEYLT